MAETLRGLVALTSWECLELGYIDFNGYLVTCLLADAIHPK